MLAHYKKALLVPSCAALSAAGVPPNTNRYGAGVPLFACMEIMREKADGSPCLPLFIDCNEAKAAVEMATEADGSGGEELEVVGLTLQSAIYSLLT